MQLTAAGAAHLCYDRAADARVDVRPRRLSAVTVVVQEAQRITRALLWGVAVLSLAACGDGELETVTTIQGICTDELRLAVLVTVINPDDLEIDSVTAARADEEPCFLENPSLRGDDDAGEPEGALYSCWEQGVGRYTVRVKSGDKEWTDSVVVPGNTCHVTKVKKLSIELK